MYCIDRLPGELAKSTEVTIHPTLAQIEASTILAKEATVVLRPVLATIEGSTILAKESTVALRPVLASIEASAVLAKDATVAKAATVALDATVAKAASVPTLANIEASTVLAKETSVVLIKKLIKNKKILTASGSVYSLVIYDDNDIDEILRKTIKDVAGADITAIGTGVIAREMKSSV